MKQVKEEASALSGCWGWNKHTTRQTLCRNGQRRGKGEAALCLCVLCDLSCTNFTLLSNHFFNINVVASFLADCLFAHDGERRKSGRRRLISLIEIENKNMVPKKGGLDTLSH